MIDSRLVYLFLVPLFLSCGNPAQKEKESASKKAADSGPVKEKKEVLPVAVDKTAVMHKKRFSGYDFEFGYTKFDPDSFENPGYLRVLRNGEIVFSDKFEGEGEVVVKSLGFHSLSGKKLVFTLNYGTAACDYTQSALYYVIDSDHQVKFLKECYASCGGDGYACHIFKHIFPEDPIGKPNTIFFAEGFVYNEHDQEDRIDTTRISFSKNAFKVKKLTDKSAN
ncbi:hypothetical protein D3C87_64830 [compost metagenome]